ncbi:hypothetical protein [Streptomyces sp. NPDC059092]|uniref:hypothetical protein n=1 Tax=Streptomyces sp. NPDC059092 TaxID=3346725 RepID=UPI003678E065
MSTGNAAPRADSGTGTGTGTAGSTGSGFDAGTGTGEATVRARVAIALGRARGPRAELVTCHGIDVTAAVPTRLHLTDDNAACLTAKARTAGHTQALGTRNDTRDDTRNGTRA